MRSNRSLKNETTRILGIDPGIALLGYGVIDCTRGVSTCVTYGCLTTPKTLPLPERLYALSVGIRQLITDHKPTVVGVETIRFAKNETTGIAVAEARGVVLAAIAEARLPIIELTPLEVKQSLTSYGHADKKQVQYMVKQILKLKETPKPDDAADALAVALATEQLYRFQTKTKR